MVLKVYVFSFSQILLSYFCGLLSESSLSLDLGLLANLDLTVARLVLVLLRCWLEVHVPFTIKHDLRDLLVKVIERVLQALFKLVSDEVRLSGPSLETLSDQVVSESLKLLVCLFHLVVLCVEKDRLLDLLHVALVENVFTDAQLFNAEVCLEGVSNSISSRLIDLAVEDFEEDEGHVAFDEFSDCQSANLTKRRVAELKRMQLLV